jgi:hypothetical protein
MFVSEERVLAAGFGEASARLAELPRGDWVRALSAVYADGVEYLRVGPVGALAAVPGASRLVRVRFAKPVRRTGMMTVGLRWEATGVTGGLFPALDADIQLSALPAGASRVVLTGSYRPPLGPLGEELDRLVLATVASATIRALLARVAAVLEGNADGKTAAAPSSRPEPTLVLPAPGDSLSA